MIHVDASVDANDAAAPPRTLVAATGDSPRAPVGRPSARSRRRSPAAPRGATARSRRGARTRASAPRRASSRCATSPARAPAPARRRAQHVDQPRVVAPASGRRRGRQRTARPPPREPERDRPRRPEPLLDRSLERQAGDAGGTNEPTHQHHPTAVKPRTASETSSCRPISNAAAVPACSATSNALRRSPSIDAYGHRSSHGTSSVWPLEEIGSRLRRGRAARRARARGSAEGRAQTPASTAGARRRRRTISHTMPATIATTAT